MSRIKKLEAPQVVRNEKGIAILTEEYILKACEFEGFYTIPKYNNTLYLHFKGFMKIENLDNFVNVKVLYLESNNICKIENLSHLKQLSLLYLQDNHIQKIENLEQNTELSVLKLSGNRIEVIENLECLTKLHNFHIDKNIIHSYKNILKLKECPSIAVVKINFNILS